MMIRPAVLAALMVPFVAAAQTPTVEELRALIDKEVAGMNEYRKLLSDPDPQRSISAMKVMMASGDPELERMAREYGLYSSNPQVRRTTLEAWLAGGPVLELWIDGSSLEDSAKLSWFDHEIKRLGGAIAAGPKGFFSLPVGQYDDDQECWVVKGKRRSACLARLSEQSVGIYIYNAWASFKLNDEGTLVGEVAPQNVGVPLPSEIAVTR